MYDQNFKNRGGPPQFLFLVFVSALSPELHANDQGLTFLSVKSCARLVGEGLGEGVGEQRNRRYLPKSHTEIQEKLPAVAKLVVEVLDEPGAEAIELLRAPPAPGPPPTVFLKNILKQLQAMTGHFEGSSSLPGALSERLRLAMAETGLLELIEAYTILDIENNIYTDEIFRALQNARQMIDKTKAGIGSDRQRRIDEVREEKEQWYRAVLSGAREVLSFLKEWHKHDSNYANLSPEDLVKSYNIADEKYGLEEIFIRRMKDEFVSLFTNKWGTLRAESDREKEILSFYNKWSDRVKDLRIFFEAVKDLEIQKRLEPPAERLLWFAATVGDVDMAKRLLPHMTAEQVMAKNNVKQTALMLAVVNNHADVVEVFWEYLSAKQVGVDSSTTTEFVSRAFIRAAESGYLKIVEIFLPHMTEEQIGGVDSIGNTAHYWAKINGYNNVKNLIEARLKELTP